jgi:hypothetical protein
MTGPEADVVVLEVLGSELVESAVDSVDEVELSEDVVSEDDEPDVVSEDVVSEDVVSEDVVSEDVVSADVMSDDSELSDDISDDVDDEIAGVVTLPTVVPSVGVPAVSLLPHAVRPTVRAAARTATRRCAVRVEKRFISCPSSSGYRPTDPGLQRR